MSVRRFFITQLIPALDEFLVSSSNRDIDHGADIASAARLAEILNSLPERIKLEVPCPIKATKYVSTKRYRESTWADCPAYEYVCDFAIAYKHETVSRQGRTIDRLDRIHPRAAFCIYKDSEGEYNSTQKLLWMRLLNGSAVDLRRALVESAKYWTNELVQFHLVEPIEPNRFLYSEHISRPEAAKLPNLRLHQIAGENYGNLFHVLEYDYNSGYLRVPEPGKVFEISMDVDIHTADSPFVRPA
jgi:hypothetical protein